MEYNFVNEIYCLKNIDNQNFNIKKKNTIMKNGFNKDIAMFYTFQ